MSTKIEWTDETWNPVTGCTKVSQGCKNCYAERLWPKVEGARVKREGGEVRPFTQVVTMKDRLQTPLHWTRPRRVFVNSMSDLFHEDIPDAFIDQVFSVMGSCPWHTFQVLTKRPRRMLEWFSEQWQVAAEDVQRENHEVMKIVALECGISAAEFPPFTVNNKGEDRFDQVYAAHCDMSIGTPAEQRLFDAERFWTKDGTSQLIANGWPLPNVWIGVSVEDQDSVDERVPLLLQTPAAVRFISAEPLLDLIDLIGKDVQGSCLHVYEDRPRLDWVIAGGESGPNARPSHPDWFRLLRDQCEYSGVPFFFKQWGEWGPVVFAPATAHREDRLVGDHTNPVSMRRIGKKAAGRTLDGRTHDKYPCLCR